MLGKRAQKKASNISRTTVDRKAMLGVIRKWATNMGLVEGVHTVVPSHVHTNTLHFSWNMRKRSQESNS